ncbi:HAD family hydrolase [Nocardioides sp. ChNu-153]|uniref:HAD family hydrolase n=1 Tax=unclassified Nocardioides TaxID=2615069 RepID=UPI002404E46B|nr:MULTISPECIES: HAD family hydrolase [unclassified Nocardioides]MDF9717122.1 HAD family hydrolase [Nocardioides sp. ChNu-99]MDN7121927.1 HAD family hydrolase [Nocardioides sp. ChNu-153]
MAPRLPLAAVLFDLDDTLVDHRGAARAGLVAWAAGLGLPGTPAELAERWTLLEMRHHAAYQRGELTFAEQRRARVRAFVPHLDLREDAAADEAFAGFSTAYRAAWRAFADARRALERAHAAGLAVGVLTNGDLRRQRSKVERVGLAPVLDALDAPVLASSALRAAKPDARAYAAACAHLGTPVGATLMVGDSLANDVRGAARAGLRAVLLDRYDEHPTAGVRRVRSLDALDFAAA